jgi:hypothetical protein
MGLVLESQVPILHSTIKHDSVSNKGKTGYEKGGRPLARR